MKIQFIEKWQYLIREISIVVIGVLLAFILNSWWTNGKERKIKSQLIENLRAELESSNQELERTLKIHNYVLENAIELEKILESCNNAKEVFIPDTTLIAVLIAATYNPSLGSINSVLASGKIDIVNNRDLVLVLSTWNTKLEDAIEDEITSFDIVEDKLIPYLSAIVDVSKQINNTGHLASYKLGRRDSIDPSLMDSGLTLNCNYQLNNLIALRKMRMRVTIAALDRLHAHQTKILDLISGDGQSQT